MSDLQASFPAEPKGLYETTQKNQHDKCTKREAHDSIYGLQTNCAIKLYS